MPTATQRLGFFGLGCCFCALFFGTAIATPPTEEEVYRLGEIVVTGTREGVAAVGTTRVVTAEEIQRRDARNLNEALELLPGVTVRVGAQGTPRIDVRGLRTRHVKLLINGVPFNSTFDGQFDPTLIPTEQIAEIKFTTGASSELYGEGPIGAVINIITRKGVTGLRAVLSAERGDGDHHRVWGRLSGAKQDTDFFISVSHQNQQGFPLSDDFEPTAFQGQGLRENSDRERANLFANLGYRPNQDWQLGLTFNHTRGEQGVPPIIIEDNKDPFASRPRFERVDDLEGYSVQLAATFDPTGPWAARSWLYFNSLDQEENRYDDNQYNTITDRNNFHKENTNRVMGFHVQPSFEFGPEGLLSVAFDGRRESFDETGFIQTARNRSQPLAQDNEVFVYSAALEYSFKPLPELGLVFGYGHHWQDREQGSSDNSNSFITGAYYDLSPQTRFRASVSRKVRVPSIRQLYESISGDPNLNFETAYLYEIGARYQFNSANSVDLALFHTDVEDFIEKNRLTDRFENNQEYRFRGIELTGETRPWERLRLRVRYTHLDNEDRSSGSEIDELQYRPENKVSFEAFTDFGYGFQGYLSLLHVADQFFYSRQEPVQKAQLDNFTLLNFKLDWNPYPDQLTLYLGVNNLLNENYEQSYGFPQAGRFVFGGMILRI